MKANMELIGNLNDHILLITLKGINTILKKMQKTRNTICKTYILLNTRIRQWK